MRTYSVALRFYWQLCEEHPERLMGRQIATVVNVVRLEDSNHCQGAMPGMSLHGDSAESRVKFHFQELIVLN